jgi:hypothetical protein
MMGIAKRHAWFHFQWQEQDNAVEGTQAPVSSNNFAQVAIGRKAQ